MATSPIYYTVVRGDSLSKIASRFGVTVAMLVEWNSIENPNLIRVGQVLVVGWEEEPEPDPEPEPGPPSYTKEEIDAAFQQVSADIEELAGVVTDLASTVGNVVASLGARADDLETRAEGLEERTRSIEIRADGLDGEVGELKSEVGKLKDGVAVLESRVGDLEESNPDPDPDPDPTPPPTLSILAHMSTFSVTLVDDILTSKFVGEECELRLHVGNPGIAGTANRAMKGSTPAVGKPLSFSQPDNHDSLSARTIESTNAASWTGSEIDSGQEITHYTIWADGKVLDIGTVDDPVTTTAEGVLVEAGGVQVSVAAYLEVVEPDPDPDPDPDPSPYDPPSDPDAYVTNLSQLGLAVGSLSAGAVIVLADGTYNVNDITLKAGMQLWAENLHGAVINGGNTRMWAFAAHNPSSPLEDVELHGLVIKDYLNTVTGHAPVGNTGAKGWVYEDLEVYGNSRAGISLGENSTVRRVYCHDNGETGIASSQRSAGCVIEDSVLEANGFAFGQNDWKTSSGSTGGMKLLRNLAGSGDPLVVRNVVARDNNGPGFWIDYVRNIEVTFEGCDAHDNEGPGFFLEASRPGPILVDGCHVSGTKQWPGIYVSGSEVVTVQNCEVSGRGIMVSEDNTSDRKVREAYVLDNTVTNLVSGSHGAQSQSGANIFDSTKIVFAGNSYPGVSGSPFRWAGSNLSLVQWRSVHGGE